MKFLGKATMVLVVVIAAIMTFPSATAVSAAGSSQLIHPATVPSLTPQVSTAGPTGPVSAAAAAAHRLSDALTADHVPKSQQLLPSLNPDVTVHDGMLTPSYSTLVAPVGIADYGIQESGGKNVASITYTPGVKGTLSLNQLSLMYPYSAGPDEFTAQENAVLTGVTVHGVHNLQFWTQNVIYYYQSDHALHLASAIVNFSSSAFNFPASTIVTGHGSIDPGFGYFYPNGPTFTVPEPFTISFLENGAVVNNEPAVYFNYSIAWGTHTVAGSYDLVEFNASATGGMPKGPSPRPTYQINGEALGGTGYIPNDVELIIGGDGGGSIATVTDISGTMQLLTQANGTGRYASVPAAYDFGSETGETAVGIAEWASGGSTPTVHLGPGPSLETPLWGVAGSPPLGHSTATFHVSPSNAFVFVSPGTSFNTNAATWALVPADGTAVYALPAGAYSYYFLLSDFAPRTVNLNLGSGVASTRMVTLSSDRALGVYTPLWAWSDAQLAAISQGGTGSLKDPYVLDNNAVGALNPLFGQFNDYIFPVFPGVQLVDTTDYVSIVNAPSFTIAYSLPWEAYYLNVYFRAGLYGNNLGYFFYGVEHVSVVSTPLISGWFSYAVYGGATMLFWNSSYNLVAGNSLQIASLGIYMFGGGHNTLWGNALTTIEPPAGVPGYILNYGDPLGLELWESKDLIFNNAFVTGQTAVTPPYNPYDFNYVPELWKDTWNVPKEPASAVNTVNGWKLSGSILGLSWIGGNYWWNYGAPSNPYGVLPYDNSGLITYHGDYLPLVPFTLYAASFHETGLPHGKAWSITVAGYTQTTTTTSMTFWEPNGTYAYVVGPLSGWKASPSDGALIMSGASVSVAIHWSAH